MSPSLRYAVPNAFLPIRAKHLVGKKAAGVKHVLCAGELVVPTGRLVACDPLVQPERPPFERAVAPGQYAVYLFVAKEGSAIGFAEIRLQETPIERFVIATLPGQDASALRKGKIFGYPVDAGLGCFADEAALQRLRDADAAIRRAQGASYVSYYDAVVSTELAANGGSWVNHRPDPASPENVVIMRSGDGDGSYATYFGLDAAGEAACLVTSFGCFAEPVSQDQKLRALTASYARLVDEVERAIGAVLRSKGFSGPAAAYKTTADGGELRLEYTRDGLSFEVESSMDYGVSYTLFRWKRGRSTLDVGNEHRKAGLPLKLPPGVGDAAYTNAARIGASYAKHWEALERAVLGFLPLKAAKAKKVER